MTEQPARDQQSPPDYAGMIASLRQQGADQFDPVRFHFIEAMAKRAQMQPAPVRCVVDGKLAKALADYRQRFEQVDKSISTTASLERKVSDAPLADLLNHIEQQSAQATDEDPTELKSLRQFRDDWSKLRVNQTVSQALAAGPTNAGPLNSHALVLQALRQMRDTAPDYLGRFMAYADTLLWLEQANSNNTPVKKSAARGKAAKKRKPD